MSHNDTTAYDSTVSGNNVSDSGMIHVPAQAQRDEGICLDDPVEVTLSDLDHEFIESLSFEGVQTAGDSVTVPARIMREAGIEGGDEVTATFEKVEEDTDDEEPESLGESHGATDEEVEESVDSLDDLFADDEEDEAETEDEGLGELFA